MFLALVVGVSGLQFEEVGDEALNLLQLRSGAIAGFDPANSTNKLEELLDLEYVADCTRSPWRSWCKACSSVQLGGTHPYHLGWQNNEGPFYSSHKHPELATRGSHGKFMACAVLVKPPKPAPVYTHNAPPGMCRKQPIEHELPHLETPDGDGQGEIHFGWCGLHGFCSYSPGPYYLEGLAMEHLNFQQQGGREYLDNLYAGSKLQGATPPLQRDPNTFVDCTKPSFFEPHYDWEWERKTSNIPCSRGPKTCDACKPFSYSTWAHPGAGFSVWNRGGVGGSQASWSESYLQGDYTSLDANGNTIYCKSNNGCGTCVNGFCETEGIYAMSCSAELKQDTTTTTTPLGTADCTQTRPYSDCLECMEVGSSGDAFRSLNGRPCQGVTGQCGVCRTGQCIHYTHDEVSGGRRYYEGEQCKTHNSSCKRTPLCKDAQPWECPAGSTCAYQNRKKECSDFLSKGSCPAHCRWKGNECVEPSCSDHSEKEACPADCAWNADTCKEKTCPDYNAANCPKKSCVLTFTQKCVEPPCSLLDAKEACLSSKCSWKDGECKPMTITTTTTTPQPVCADLSTEETCKGGKDCWWHDGKCVKPPCGEHTKETCPAAETCKWDGKQYKCVVRKCVDYKNQETCPKICEWTGGICKPTLPFEFCPIPGKVGSNECPDGCTTVDDCDECAVAAEYWIEQGRVKKNYSDDLWPEHTAPRPQGCFRNKGWKEIKCNPFAPDAIHNNGKKAVGPKKNKAPICKKVVDSNTCYAKCDQAR